MYDPNLEPVTSYYCVQDTNEYRRALFYFSICFKGCNVEGKSCNCDNVDGDWYADGGLLTDRGQLPVTQLRFGGNEESKYTLGPLECNATSKLGILLLRKSRLYLCIYVNK